MKPENLGSANFHPSQYGTATPAPTLIRMVNLQTFVFDNISLAVSQNMPIESLEKQAMPLLNNLKTEIENTVDSAHPSFLSSNRIQTFISDIGNLETTLKNRDYKNFKATLDQAYNNLRNSLPSEMYELKPSHIIAEELKDDPFMQNIKTELEKTGNVMRNGWIVFSSAEGSIGESVNKTGIAKVTVLISNARQAEANEFPEHEWDVRREDYVDMIFSQGSYAKNPKNTIIGLQEINNKREHQSSDGLTQAEYIRKNMPPNYNAIPPGDDGQLEYEGLMMLYDKNEVAPVGEMIKIDLGRDPVGNYQRNMLGQLFQIKGTNEFFYQFVGHGPHNKTSVPIAMREIEELNKNGYPVIAGGDFNEYIDQAALNKGGSSAKTTTQIEGMSDMYGYPIPTKTGRWEEGISRDLIATGANDTIVVEGPQIDLSKSKGHVYDVAHMVKGKKVGITDHRPVQETLVIDYNKKAKKDLDTKYGKWEDY